MAHDPAFADTIREKFHKSAQRVKRAESALEKAQQEHGELAVTMRTLVRLGLIEDAEAEPAGQAGPEMNDDQALVLRVVPKGEAEATTPKEVIDILHAGGERHLSGDYIRTTLWRFAKRGTLKSSNGRYWWPSTPPPPEAKKAEAPDAETSEASTDTGPADGSQRRATHLDAEGSIPSGSTPSSNAGDPVFDDDDDNPPAW